MLQLAKHTLQAEDGEHSALYACCDGGVALCTIVGIEGSFSRRIGAQLAVFPDGEVVGSLADGCLERQLASDVRNAAGPVVKRYGTGSPNIDFRLPCGGGLDILIDPAPDLESCCAAAKQLHNRDAATLQLADNAYLHSRHYVPALRLRIFGEGPELAALEAIARAAGIEVEAIDKNELSLGQRPILKRPDEWTAIVLLFHDHEWETALLDQALESEAFYIGAQGGETARMNRMARLLSAGLSEQDVARIRGPIGTIPACRTPSALALSILSEIAGIYEALQPRH